MSLPQSTVQINLEGKDLLDMDTFSKSDPKVWVYMQNKSTNKWMPIGETEQIDDNLNPVWTKSITLTYRFEELQMLKFMVYDIDDPEKDFAHQDFIGSTEIALGSIVGAKGSRVLRKLKNPKYPEPGSLIISCEEVTENTGLLTMGMRAENLDRKGLFTSCHPFLRISRVREDGNFSAIFKTSVVKSKTSPVWEDSQQSLQNVCNNDLDRTLKIECIHMNSNGKEDPIGECVTTVNKLQLLAEDRNPLVLNNPKKNKPAGNLFITKCSVVHRHSFLEYVQGGMEINLIVGIDFTASNGNPDNPSSLHYRNGQHQNEYQTAIRSICNILCSYDDDNLFPVFGFGAKIPPAPQVYHCFPLNGNPQSPEVFGLDGILQAYNDTLHKVQLFGPTNFAQIVNVAGRYAYEAKNDPDQKYIILLMLTDGEISDMQFTIDEIVKASELPLSIVIIGVGDGCDFKNMDILDADDDPLKDSNGKLMARDIVQFVPFKDCKGYESRAAELTLEEIPGQVVSYFEGLGIAPKPPVQQSNANLTHTQTVAGHSANLSHQPTGHNVCPYPI